jgi:hypothetical protein
MGLYSIKRHSQVAKRIFHPDRNRKALERLRNEQCFIRIAGHQSSAFAYWAPKLHHLYSDIVSKLMASNPSLRFNFFNSIFACATYNFGPQTTSLEHLDFGNYIAGWCAITALGRFDYTRGGHLVLWDLRLVVEFPPGWTILIPSAYL